MRERNHLPERDERGGRRGDCHGPTPGASATTGERAQAYTLEGFVGAMIVLLAVLFALNSVVIVPSTGGAVDRTQQAQLQAEAGDALAVSEARGDLSHVVRYWNGTNERYHDGHGDARPGAYDASAFADEAVMNAQFGAIVGQRFVESGRSYNVELRYRGASGGENVTDLVYQGRPSPNAISASQTVTLTDSQTLTAPGDEDVDLGDAATNHDYPIPDEGAGELYNVVEVRVTVW